MYRTYVMTFPPNANLNEIERYVRTDTRIASYWNYLPYVFCVKTEMSASELANLFAAAASSYFIAEINAGSLAMGTSISGRLPKSAWDWFQAPLPPVRRNPFNALD
jgi:hypothetical protein